MHNISANTLIIAYKNGIFPMAPSAKSNEIIWVNPRKRGIIPIGSLHVSRSTRKFIRQQNFEATINTSFSIVLKGCSNRQETWINEQLSDLYLELNEKGYALSIEIWLNKRLIGGLLGVIIGSCFFGESMFSTYKNASKLALIVVMARLVHGNFTLFDTQFMTNHLISMGGRELSQKSYMAKLRSGIDIQNDFFSFPESYSWSQMIHLSSQNL